MSPIARRILVLVGVGLAGAVAALAALTFLPPTKADLGPGTVSLRARCCLGGETTVLVPPIGSISADTHRSSVDVEAQIDEVDVEALQALGGADDPDDELVAQIEQDLPGLLRRFALRSLLMGVVAGIVVGLLVPGRRWHTALVGGAGGLVAVLAVVAVVGTSYDDQAFAEPRFEGTLSEAPRVIEAASQYVEDFDDVEDRIEVLGAQIGQLYETSVTDALATPDADEVRVLHISDVHLNPIGIEVAEDLATRFQVDVVLDTGDLTTFGLPAEARLGDELDFEVPYLFVPGNHDSEENRAALADVDGVTLLDGDVFELEGDDEAPLLRILGVGDPTFTAENDVDDDEVDAALEEQAAEVAELVAEEQPDVLAVHNLLQAADVGGEVPLVVGGHNHRRSEREDDGTILLTVGSTGATGVGSFTVDEDHPYEAEVLRFVDGELIGVDHLTLSGVQGEFTIDRTLYPDGS
jgi:predicted phosphodiesterase